MPGFYPENEYDLAGFCVGMADREKLIDRETQREGDVLIALPSSGVHSNGFSLVRRVLDAERADLRSPLSELGGRALGETLLCPTKIYVKPVLSLMEGVTVKGVAHITGGGFYENIPRCLKNGLGAKIEKSAVRVPPIFSLIARRGGIAERDMFNTFNMGVGMCVVVAAGDADKALQSLRANGEAAYVLGELAPSEEGVSLC
jgi:phosphoribosylformylglycinamidine cyclo-ligase